LRALFQQLRGCQTCILCFETVFLPDQTPTIID
jgi:hypothetical protein